MKKAVIYCRFSPRKKLAGKEIMSNEIQDTRATEYCRFKGWHILQRFADEFKSGATTRRPGLDAAIDMAIAHEAILVVYSLSRLSRSLVDMIQLSETLSKAGCDLASVTENVDTTTPMGRAFFAFIGVINQLERETIAERTSEAMHYRLQNGVYCGGGSPHYGWEWEDQDKLTLKPCPYEVEVIERACQLYNEGYPKITHNQVYRQLAEEGYYCRDGKEFHPQLSGIRLRRAVVRAGAKMPRPRHRRTPDEIARGVPKRG